MRQILSPLVLLSCMLLGAVVQGQSPGSQESGPGPAASEARKSAAEKNDPKEERTAAQLFDDADGYVKKKFDAFEKAKMPYDDQVAEKVKKEQRELAARYASTLAARQLEGRDVYYLGMLYNLANNSSAAFEAMRRFLKETPEAAGGEPAQNARAIVIMQAVKQGLLPEAEDRLSDYAKNQPQVPEDRYALEKLLTAAYFKKQDYQDALPHAQEVWTAAKVVARKKGPFSRDTMLSEAATLVSEIDLKLQKKDEALATVESLREMALELPSGNLHKLALRRLIEIDPKLDLFKMIDAARPVSSVPPEIKADEWIDQTPTKLADLRGRVVLLDFWAPWCFPCRATFPRLQKWNETYKDKGLVILGLTNFFGNAEGKELTRPQELTYLRDFKRKFHLPYGVVVADSNENDRNYAVSSIPTTFLIDRRGVVRFISIGSSDVESAALAKMIKKLIDEPAENASAVTDRK